MILFAVRLIAQRWADKGFLRLTETECTHELFVDMNQILRELETFSVQLQLGGHATGSEGQALFLLLDALAGGSA